MEIDEKVKIIKGRLEGVGETKIPNIFDDPNDIALQENYKEAIDFIYHIVVDGYSPIEEEVWETVGRKGVIKKPEIPSYRPNFDTKLLEKKFKIEEIGAKE